MTITRRHDIDALRSLAFLLLIFYHIGMFYVSWDWHVKSQYDARWLEPLMLIVNQWRMPLIFVISGLAVNFVLGDDGQGKKPAAFIGHRFKRLGLPLLTGLVLLIPPQAYYEALSNGATEAGYFTFLWRYFSFQPWPAGAFAGSDSFITWNHLWYLHYLLLYTLAILPIQWLLRRFHWARSARRQAQGQGLWMILGPVAWLMPIGLFIFPLSPGIRHNLIDDWYAHAMFGSFFLFGFLIGTNRQWWSKLKAIRWPLLALSIASFALFRSGLTVFPEATTAAQYTAMTFITYLNRVSWILLILAWGYHYLNRPMKWLQYANRAVFFWYILHQTIIVVVGYELSKFQLGPVVEPALVIGATLLGCLGGFWLIDATAVLRPWFGINTPKSTSPPKPSGATQGSLKSD